MKKQIIYWIEDHGQEFGDHYEYSTYHLDDLAHVAELCAADYHNNHDGWDSVWPLIFTIADDDGNVLCRAYIDRRSRPVFEAGILK